MLIPNSQSSGLISNLKLSNKYWWENYIELYSDKYSSIPLDSIQCCSFGDQNINTARSKTLKTAFISTDIACSSFWSSLDRTLLKQLTILNPLTCTIRNYLFWTFSYHCYLLRMFNSLSFQENVSSVKLKVVRLIKICWRAVLVTILVKSP